MTAVPGTAIVTNMYAADGAGHPAGSAILTPLGQMGNGAGNLIGLCGNASSQLSGAGINPGATGADNVLAVFSLPANSFDIAGRGINIVAQGSVANNTNSKRMKLYFGCTTAVVGSTVTGGTVVADTGAYTTANAVGWALEANVYKYGAAGSNTQLGLHQAAQIGATVGSLLAPASLTATENAAILIAVTGNAATTATDIVLYFFE
jgi:hypothetical protein